MKLRYPAEAFALGIILFSAGMKEAFAAGILVIFTSVFAELLKNLLEKAVPAWSLQLCVYIASGSVCASAFLVGFAVLGTALTTELWIMVFLVGLLCARHALSGNTEAEYGELLWESAIAWGLWILLAIFREFMGTGSIFGNTLLTASFQSKAFQQTIFAFLAAGLVLAFTNGIYPVPPVYSGKLWRSSRNLMDHPCSCCSVPFCKTDLKICPHRKGLPRSSCRYAGSRIYLYDTEHLLKINFRDPYMDFGSFLFISFSASL